MPELDPTLTIRPQPRCAIAGASARIRRIGAITWSSYKFDSKMIKVPTELRFGQLVGESVRTPEAAVIRPGVGEDIMIDQRRGSHALCRSLRR